MIWDGDKRSNQVLCSLSKVALACIWFACSYSCDSVYVAKCRKLRARRTKSPRREVVTSSAGAGIVYPPIFGVIRVAYPKA